MNRKLYQILASLVEARENCVKSGNTDWLIRHGERAENLARNHLPSGSGFDDGTHLALNASTPNVLVLYTAFHHMDEHGYYDGWTEHTIRVKASLAHGFVLTVSGPNRNDIKDMIAEIFTAALDADVEV